MVDSKDKRSPQAAEYSMSGKPFRNGADRLHATAPKETLEDVAGLGQSGSKLNPSSAEKSKFRVPVVIFNADSSTKPEGVDPVPKASHAGAQDDHDFTEDAVYSNEPFSQEQDFDGLDASHPQNVSCPMCGQFIDPLTGLDLELETIGSNIRKQTQFCMKHRKREAMTRWRAEGYPTIDWDNLTRRLSTHRHALARVLRSPSLSHFRKELEKHVRMGKDRTLLMQMKHSGIAHVSSGYYGSRGLKSMYVALDVASS